MILRSRFMLGSSWEVLEGEDLRLEGDWIVERGPEIAPAAGERVEDLGQAVLFPGWINAHAHLELSGLVGKLPRGQGFLPWVEAAVRGFRDLDSGFFERGVERGIREALRAGTTTICDVTTRSVSGSRLGRSGMRAIVCEEALALDETNADETLEMIRKRVERLGARDPMLRPGVAPHSPYTVSPRLFSRLADLAREQAIPLSVHLSESLEEIRMIERGDGPMLEFLRSQAAVPQGWTPPGARPVRYLDRLGVLGRGSLLVHCNYLDDDDLERIRCSGAAVVFCPASHCFFGHQDHPLPRLLERGVTVALGTDSLGSNDSLSMLEEVRELARQFPGLAPEERMEIAIRGGARALGLASEIGALEPGYQADLVAYDVEQGTPRQGVLELVLERGKDPFFCLVQGVTPDGWTATRSQAGGCNA